MSLTNPSMLDSAPIETSDITNYLCLNKTRCAALYYEQEKDGKLPENSTHNQ